MKKKYRMLLNIIFILIIVFIILVIAFKIGSYFKKVKTYNVIDTINEYNYTLDDRDTSLMKDEFNNLKDILKKDEINYQDYASSLSKLFIIDLFTIANKENKYDVGGLEYVFPNVRDNFKLNVEDTLYKYLNNDNKNNYPIVKEITKVEVDNTSYTYNKKKYDAYKIIVDWNYEKDLGYYNKGELVLINDNDILYIVSFKGVEES